MIISEESIHRHRIRLYEHTDNGGVDAVLVTCYSCNESWEFPHEDYPKYRLALAAARQKMNEHAEGVDIDNLI